MVLLQSSVPNSLYINYDIPAFALRENMENGINKL